MIKIEQLEFHYRQKKKITPVVNIPSLQIHRNKKTMISGKSGCGKTTLLNLIAGIFLPNTGSIHINDQSISELSDGARRLYRLNHIGYVLQDFSLVPHLKLQDNIKLPFYINPKFSWKEEHQQNLRELSERLRVDQLLTKYPEQLSIGEKQRACLCRALVTRPSLILADEPTANLDEENRDIVLGILDDYIKEHQAALVMVCHDMGIKNWFDELVPFKEVNRV
jgi:putative ABC transport system ATP-binding protein